jgi:hypothetical protein
MLLREPAFDEPVRLDSHVRSVREEWNNSEKNLRGLEKTEYNAPESHSGFWKGAG